MSGSLGHCGCNRLGGLGAETVVSTAPRLPCTQLYQQYLNSNSIWDGIRYNLCLAWNKMGNYALDLGHWTRRMWDSLVAEFQSLWSSTKNAVGGMGSAISNGAQSLWQKTKNFLGDLDTWLGHVADNLYDEIKGTASWLLWAGAIVAVIYVAPALFEVADAGNTLVKERKR